jgi:hypothetical protein
LPFTEHYLNDAFHLHLPENEAVDLYNPELKSARDLKKKLYRPLELCKYCEKNVGVPWQQVHTSKILSDYLVE